MENISTLNAIRSCRGCTKEEAAKIANVTRSYMSAILNGKRQMKKETLIIFLEKMGFTYEQYLDLEKYKNNLEQMSMSNEDKWQRLLLQSLLIFFTNYNMRKSEQEKTFQKSLGGK